MSAAFTDTPLWGAKDRHLRHLPVSRIEAVVS